MATGRCVKLVPILALLATFNAIGAEWIPLSTNPDGDIFFIDKASIRKNAELMQVWTMANLGVPKSNGARSQKTAFLLNCQTWEWAVRAGVSYSEINGQGQIVNSISARPHEINYQPSIPDSVTDKVLSFVCSSSR